jgi:hypothetical protein
MLSPVLCIDEAPWEDAWTVLVPEVELTTDWLYEEKRLLC